MRSRPSFYHCRGTKTKTYNKRSNALLRTVLACLLQVVCGCTTVYRIRSSIVRGPLFIVFAIVLGRLVSSRLVSIGSIRSTHRTCLLPEDETKETLCVRSIVSHRIVLAYLSLLIPAVLSWLAWLSLFILACSS